MHASAVFFALAALKGAMASPIEGPEVGAVEARAPAGASGSRGSGGSGGSSVVPSNMNIPFNSIPSMGGNGCGNSQTNLCSNGSPYCCVSDGKGGNICNATNSCNQNLICCNNMNGFQMCIGSIDFSAPITININLKK